MNSSAPTSASMSGTDRDDDSKTPHARPAEPMRPDHDQLHARQKTAEDRQEALIDEAVEETFPASDPVSAKRIT
ncbi:MAG: hypothetical protein Q8S03_07185 [Brevundimonas sp.]|uniref:hypothetical protein n=1 Tax=Brevundimonas sp. TaxID=1871086 RepID=UPI0027354DB3|nr:hypothetical protein [Brevundimonas sp.]MDP3404458.1 hypothetical protein [Brevundimonas sp.]